jgi:hypothetical protein
MGKAQQAGPSHRDGCHLAYLRHMSIRAQAPLAGLHCPTAFRASFHPVSACLLQHFGLRNSATRAVQSLSISQNSRGDIVRRPNKQLRWGGCTLNPVSKAATLATSNHLS